MLKKIKLQLFQIIQTNNNLAGRIFDISIITLIILNVILVLIDTFPITEPLNTIFSYIQWVSVILFTLEYFARLWTADLLFPQMSAARARLKYAFSFMSVIDLLAIIPFYIPFIFPIDLRVLRMLRIVRLLQVFKLNRYTNALTMIGSVFKQRKNQLISSLFIIFILITIASVLMYNIENEAQPDVFQNAFSAFWWAIATFSTVGYGDIYPITVLGKILSAVIQILGIGLFAIPTGIISAGFIDIATQKRQDQKQYCPHCGKKL